MSSTLARSPAIAPTLFGAIAFTLAAMAADKAGLEGVGAETACGSYQSSRPTADLFKGYDATETAGI